MGWRSCVRGHWLFARAVPRGRTFSWSAKQTSQKHCVRRSFADVLEENPLLLVAGDCSEKSCIVAVAAGIALSRKGSTFIVDADEPALRMSDVLGLELRVSEPTAVPLPGGGSLSAARLSALDTREFLTRILASDDWRRLIETDSGTRFVKSLGVPVNELLDLLDILRPPPGCEMPIALARLLQSESGRSAKSVVVDGGAAALVDQLQRVPPSISDTLGAILRLHHLLEAGRAAAVPTAVVAGLRMLVGTKPEGLSLHLGKLHDGLVELHADMTNFAASEKAVLLVLSNCPDVVTERAALRVISRVQPSCVAWVGADPSEGLAPRPHWMPPDLPVVSLPWGHSVPTGIEEISAVADMMLEGASG